MKLDYLDKLCSEHGRKRAMKLSGGCQRCHAPKFDVLKDNGKVFPAWKHLQWCHYEGRSNYGVRYDPDNYAGCCGGCHLYIDEHPQAKEDLFRKLLGDKGFENLKLRIRFHQKLDPAAVELDLKQQIKELEK